MKRGIKNPDFLPESPGVYLFKDSTGKIIYIGKSLNLRKRVSSYFTGKPRSLLTRELVGGIHSIDFLVTTSDEDAFLLEFNLIKNHKPKYNIKLKDGTSYPFIQISTNHEYPAICITRKREPGSFFTPPVNKSYRLRQYLDLLVRVFGLRTCSDREFSRGRVCNLFHIGRCPGPCEGRISGEKYLESVAQCKELLKGKKSEVLRKLKKEMLAESENLNFERAETIRENIDMVGNFSFKSEVSVSDDRPVDILIYNESENDGFSLIYFNVFKGALSNHKSYRTFSDDPVWVSVTDFIISFYSESGEIPLSILVNREFKDYSIAELTLKKFFNKSVKFEFPKTGRKRSLINMGIRNLNSMIILKSYSAIAEELKSSLDLKKLPYIIEGYDISHLSETNRVGAKVSFDSGIPYKRAYRNYKISNVASGDTEALKHIVRRRFRSETGCTEPDLLLIDGGKGQLSAVLSVKKELGFSSDVIAIAKQEERIFSENGKSVVFPKDSACSFLLQNIRDEVHRRAVSFHRKLREV